jgi:hypothetical protein
VGEASDELWSGATFTRERDPGRAARIIVVEADTPETAGDRVRVLLTDAGLEGYGVHVLDA